MRTQTSGTPVDVRILPRAKDGKSARRTERAVPAGVPLLLAVALIAGCGHPAAAVQRLAVQPAPDGPSACAQLEGPRVQRLMAASAPSRGPLAVVRAQTALARYLIAIPGTGPLRHAAVVIADALDNSAAAITEGIRAQAAVALLAKRTRRAAAVIDRTCGGAT